MQQKSPIGSHSSPSMSHSWGSSKEWMHWWVYGFGSGSNVPHISCHLPSIIFIRKWCLKYLNFREWYRWDMYSLVYFDKRASLDVFIYEDYAISSNLGITSLKQANTKIQANEFYTYQLYLFWKFFCSTSIPFLFFSPNEV